MVLVSLLAEVPCPDQVITSSEAAEKHLRAFEQGCEAGWAEVKLSGARCLPSSFGAVILVLTG